VYQPHVSDAAVGLILQEAVHYLRLGRLDTLVKHFDLKDAERTFDFVFQLYNFASLANEDNITLHKPFDKLAMLDVPIVDGRLQPKAQDGR